MIGQLKGIPVHEEATGGLVLDVQGVGYELACPVGTLVRAPKSDDGKATLFVHTNLRQDALELFGFCSLDERATFRQLVAVPNVGPRTALAILSALPAAELAQVIEAEDKVRLGKVPGIGKKTAERLVLELRGKVLVTLGGAPAVARPPEHRKQDLHEKLVLALTGLGYKAVEAERAAKTVAESSSETTLSALLRAALQVLSA